MPETEGPQGTNQPPNPNIGSTLFGDVDQLGETCKYTALCPVGKELI